MNTTTAVPALAMDSKTICLTLLATTSAEEVTDLLTKHPFFQTCKWKNYGNQDSNGGQIEGQMKYPTNAFVEKITNSFDALIARRCYEIDGVAPNSRDPKLPQSLLEARNRYFGTEDEVFNQRKASFRDKLYILAEGDHSHITLTVVDRGEGQTPENLEKKILSLNKLNKNDIPFAVGKYNMGGSAALRFCEYQFVLTRRAITIVDSDTPNDYSWTLVRKIRQENGRVTLYQYCVDSNDNPFSFPYVENDNLLASKKQQVKNLASHPRFDKARNNQMLTFDFQFTDGCIMKLFNYQLKSKTNIAIQKQNEKDRGNDPLAVEINLKLQKPPLPIFLIELRENFYGGLYNTIDGFNRQLERTDLIGYRDELPASLGKFGVRKVTIRVLKHVHDEPSVIGHKNRKPKILFVENGQLLHKLSDSFLSVSCGFPTLSEYLIAYVDMDNTPSNCNIFDGGREEFAKTEDYEVLFEALKRFFKEDDIFKNLEKEYLAKELAATDDKDRVLNAKTIQRVLAEYPDLLKELNRNGEIVIEGTTEIRTGIKKEKKKWEGVEDPTRFEMIGNVVSRNVKKSSHAFIQFDTAAMDNIFKRRINRWKLQWSFSTKFDVTRRGIHKGVVICRVDCVETTHLGEKDNITFSLVDSQGVIKFQQTVEFVAVKKDDPWIGSQFPTAFIPNPHSLVKIQPNSIKKIVFKTDVHHEYFDRKSYPGTWKMVGRNGEPDAIVLKLKLKAGTISTEVEVEPEFDPYKNTLTVSIQSLNNKLGRIPNIEIVVGNGIDHSPITLTIPVEIAEEVEEEEVSSSVIEPKIEPVHKEKWINRNWNENDIAEISGGDSTQLIVWWNADAKPYHELDSVDSTQRDFAHQKYATLCYVFALFQYAVIKASEKENDIINNPGKAIGVPMKGIGKALPRVVRQMLGIGNK